MCMFDSCGGGGSPRGFLCSFGDAVVELSGYVRSLKLEIIHRTVSCIHLHFVPLLTTRACNIGAYK